MRSRIGLFELITFLLIKAAGPELREKLENELICDGSLDRKVGEDVTLGCESQRDVTDESIVWKVNKTINVLVYRSRKVSPQDQAKQFKGRASQDSSWNPSKGKLAVKISSVKKTDHGVYNCSVGKGPNKIYCLTTLYIQSDSEKQAGSDTNKGLKTTTTNQGLKSMANMVTLVTSVLAASAMLYLQHY